MEVLFSHGGPSSGQSDRFCGMNGKVKFCIIDELVFGSFARQACAVVEDDRHTFAFTKGSSPCASRKASIAAARWPEDA